GWDTNVHTRLNQRFDRFRGTDANTVTECDLVATHAIQPCGEGRNVLRIDLAFKRAADNAGQCPTYVHAVLPGPGDNRGKPFKAFFDRTVDIRTAESFSGAGKNGDVFDPGSQSAAEAAHVRYQRAVLDAGLLANPLIDLFVELHRRNHFGADKLPYLDRRKPRVSQAVD